MRLWPTIAATACAALVAAGSASAAPLAYVAQGHTELGGPAQHSLAVFDVATGARVGSIDLPDEASAIAISPDASRAYVGTNVGLDVVALPGGALLKAIPGLFGDVAVDPDGKRVFVTHEAANTVDVVDTATLTVGTPIAVGDEPRAVVVDSAGKHAYSGNTGSPESVSQIDLTTNLETSKLPGLVLDRPENIGISPTGSLVHIANFGGSAGGTSVSIAEPAAAKGTSVTVGKTPVGVESNAAGTLVVVASRDSMSLSLINPATKKVVGTIPMPFGPMSVAITPDGRRAFVVASQDEKWAIVDLVARKIVKGPVTLTGTGEVAIPPAQAPQAAFKVSDPLDRPLFDASTSKGGPIAAYSWDFGDGGDAAGTSPRVRHRYRKAGSYTVKLFESNICDGKAVFGPLGVASAGHTPFCNGSPTGTRTKVVRVPKAAVAAVRTKTAKVTASGDANVKLACVRELACKGKIAVAWKPPKSKTFVSFARVSFAKFPPKATRRVHFKLASKPLATLRAKGRLNVRVTASTVNAGHTVVQRSRGVKLVPRAAAAAAVSSR
ncbi:MAG: PKD domain-containing protein [Thermoleophilaceae bacterium]